MKRIVSILLMMMCFATGFAQTKMKPVVAHSVVTPVKVERVDSFKIKVDSLLTRIEKFMQANNERQENLNQNGRYKLYQTENIYNLLQLDTKTGMIKIVQWSLDSTEEFSTYINDTDLSYGFDYGSGCFELYPTKNMYQFILIDKSDGRKWHVQWGHKKAERWIRRIY